MHANWKYTLGYISLCLLLLYKNRVSFSDSCIRLPLSTPPLVCAHVCGCWLSFWHMHVINTVINYFSVSSHTCNICVNCEYVHWCVINLLQPDTCVLFLRFIKYISYFSNCHLICLMFLCSHPLWSSHVFMAL